MSSLYGYGYRSTYSTKDNILRKLRELGATRMEASYSGGNDEGGVDDIRVLRPRGKTDYFLHPVREHKIYQERSLTVIGTEEKVDAYPMHGPYPNKAEARKAARKKMKELPDYLKGNWQPVVGFEPVKATDDLVRLFGVEGDWEDEDQENSLYHLVDSLLESEFGSWAGEFSAHGTIYATVKDGRVWREGETSHMSWDASGGEY